MGKLYLVCFGISSKTLKNRNLKNRVFRKKSNYATIRPALLCLSQAIYAKTAFMCQISRKIHKC